MSAALDKVTKARSALILDQPFFGSLALRFILIETETMSTHGRPMKTMAVDGKHLFFHPQFVTELSLAHLKFVIAHEVMHCVWQHIPRLSGRNPAKWNAAGDYVINDFLKHLKDGAGRTMFDMPSSGLISSQFHGPDWSVDKVYNLLPDENSDDGDGGGGENDPYGSFDSILHGEGPQDQATKSEMEREWRVATIQAANSARMMGKLPSDLERFLDALLKPQVNWVEKLRAFVMDAARNDYNWQRPNKRFPDVYMPSLHDETMGEIVVVVDDSGSISNETLKTFGSEIKAIMEDCRPSKTHLIFCDADIRSHYELAPDDQLPLKIHGGGGTDFRPPFELVAEKKIMPKCLVYLTDLCGPWPSEPPPYPVMWVCVTDEVCAWGETIPIREQELT